MKLLFLAILAILAMACVACGEIDCDSGSLLARPARPATAVATAVLRTEPKPWMKRWTEAYLELEPFRISRDLVSEFIKTAVGGLVGELIGALIRWFWPRTGPSKEEALMKIILDWTQDYVGMQIAKTIKALSFSDLETAKKQVLGYQGLREVLEKEASKPWKWWHPKPIFPTEQWFAARLKLDNAVLLCDLAMDKISPTSEQKNETKAVAIPAFLTAATLKMTLLRETYNLTVFRETWKPCHQKAHKAAILGQVSYLPSKKIIDNMKSALEGLTKQTGDLKQIWLNWRQGKLECKSSTRKDWSGKQVRMKLTDKLINENFWFVGQGDDESWFDEWENQYCKTITNMCLGSIGSPLTESHRCKQGHASRIIHIFTTKVHGEFDYQGAGADVHAFCRFAAPDPWVLERVFSKLNFESEVKDCSLLHPKMKFKS